MNRSAATAVVKFVLQSYRGFENRTLSWRYILLSTRGSFEDGSMANELMWRQDKLGGT